MAPKHLNIDTLDSLKDLPSFRLNGKEYTVKSLDPKLIDEATSIVEDSMETTHAKQLAMMTGAPEEEFMNLGDVRKTTAAISFIMSAITEAGEAASMRKKPRR